MKAWTWKRGELSEGIEVVNHKRFGQVVALGRKGRGCRLSAVSLDKFRPPRMKDGRIEEASIRIICPQNGDRPFYVLSSPSKEESGHLVRIDTEWASNYTGRGLVGVLNGSPEKVELGYVSVDEHRLGTSDDVLFILRPGDEVRVRCIAREGEPGLHDTKGPKYAVFSIGVDPDGDIFVESLNVKAIPAVG